MIGRMMVSTFTAPITGHLCTKMEPFCEVFYN